jgi:hypothetical protein
LSGVAVPTGRTAVGSGGSLPGVAGPGCAPGAATGVTPGVVADGVSPDVVADGAGAGGAFSGPPEGRGGAGCAAPLPGRVELGCGAGAADWVSPVVADTTFARASRSSSAPVLWDAGSAVTSGSRVYALLPFKMLATFLLIAISSIGEI